MSDLPLWFFFFATPSFEYCLEIASWCLRQTEGSPKDTEALLRGDPGWSHRLDKGSCRHSRRRQNYTQEQCNIGSWNQQDLNFPVLSSLSHSEIWLMLTKAFVVLKHAEYLVTLLLLIATALTCAPQGYLRTGVADIVGCHGCACPKVPETRMRTDLPDERRIMSCTVIKGMLPWRQKPSTAIHTIQEMPGAPARWPGLVNLHEVCWAVIKCGDCYPWLRQSDGEVCW